MLYERRSLAADLRSADRKQQVRAGQLQICRQLSGLFDIPDIAGEADQIIAAPDDLAVNIVRIIVDGKLSYLQIAVLACRNGVQVFECQIGMYVFCI